MAESKFVLTEVEAYEFHFCNKNLTKTEKGEQLLTLTGLPIKDVNLMLDEELESFERAQAVVRKRLDRLIERVQKKRYLPSSDVFFDLKDFPTLVQEDSQKFSQSSVTSTHSWLEEAEPSQDNSDSRKRKSFDDVGSRTKRRKTDEIFDLIQNEALKLNVSTVQLIAYLGYRASHQENKTLSATFRKISEGVQTEDRKSVPLNLCMYIREQCELGKKTWTDLRLLLKPYVILVPYGQTSLAAKSILPSFTAFHHGLKADLLEVVTKTLERLPESVTEKIKSLDINASGIVANFSCGADVSGSHKEYNSETSLAEGVDTSHMMVAGIALSSIELNDQNSTTIFRNKNVSSTNSERPLVLAPGRETRDFLAATLNHIETGIEDVTKNPLRINLSHPDLSDFSVVAKIKIDVSQLDGKAVSVSLGLGGAYCTGCTVSEEEAKNPERIRELFRFNRSIQNIRQVFEELSETDSEGNQQIKKQQGDYSVRTGVTQAPLTKNLDLTKTIPITHAYLRSLSYFENLAYRINANVRKMGKGVRFSPEEKRQLEEAKNSFRKKARYGDLHMKLDQPDASGSGGNSDTAAAARQFFSAKKRLPVLNLFDGNAAEKEAIEKLLKMFSIILRVVSSKERQIDSDSFEQYCNETYSFLAESFPWASIPTSVHRLLGHSAEKIRLNSDFGLGKYSEEGLEALHKLVRRFREHCARKNSLEANLQDTFMHLWV
jgi:hypothetical protein